jgi:hypothetical protein
MGAEPELPFTLRRNAAFTQAEHTGGRLGDPGPGVFSGGGSPLALRTFKLLSMVFLNRDPLDRVEGDFLARSIVRLCRPR